MTDRFWGWAAPLVVFALAFWDRAAGVTHVRCKVQADGSLGGCFDETYYANDAHALLLHGYETRPVASTSGEYVVHPPLGKWMIAAGEEVFGVNELGWRIASVVCGSLTVLVFARLVRRMTRSTLLGTLGGALLALDGLEYVQSRVALLDVFLLFWLVVALACYAADRDDGRVRLAVREPGAPLGVRWWRVACGASLGCACAVKWSGLPLLVAVGLLAFAGDVTARRTAGAARPVRAALRRDGLPQLAAMGLLPLVVYSASWTGWFVSSGGYDRQARGPGVLNAVDAWFQYHRQALCFHAGLDDTPQRKSPLLCDGVPAGCASAPTTDLACWSSPSSHPYGSKPLGWLTISRPVAISYDTVASGATLDGQTCPAGGPACSREVLAIETPVLWWASLGALVLIACLGLVRRGWRDWRVGTAVVGALFAFVPWLLDGSRVMFDFYALPMLPFVILALVLILGAILGPASASRRRRGGGAALVVAVVLLVLADFVWLHPVLSGQLITYDAWHARVAGLLGSSRWI